MEEKRVSAPKKKISVIEVTPEECLTFDIGGAKVPGQAASAKLVINNPSDEVVCFKVKTTAPKDYCVRPNSGKLAAKSSIDISVTLQPPLPKGDTKSKDKFLVQTILEKDVVDPNSPDMWKEVPKSMIMESKLKCSWKFEQTGVSDMPATQAAESAHKIETKPAAAVSDAAKPSKISSTPPVVSPLRNVAGPSSASETKKEKSTPQAAATGSAVATAASKTEMPALMLLLGVFVLGYIFGKFVL